MKACTNPEGHNFLGLYCINCEQPKYPAPKTEEPTKVTEVDITPSWSGLLPALLELYYQYRTGDNSSTAALDELQKMARVADAGVALHKKLTGES